jgi:serine/threonine-protein kinase
MSFCGYCGGPLPTSVSPEEPAEGPPPDLPDRFRVKRLLGRGGMGRVFLCEDRDLEVDVAVKVLPEELVRDEKALETIGREARLFAKLRGCPGILQLYEFEKHGGTCFLVMEFAPGGSLAGVLQAKGALPEEECRRLGAGVADALGFAHERKVLHRDVKPGNVLLGADASVRVADFGLARVFASTTTSRSTTGGIAGTPVYLPPEVIQRKRVDHRGDLYALGCVLYEMACGEPPYLGTFAEVALAKSKKDARIPDPRESKEGISDVYAGVVRRLMAFDPVERYGDGRTVAAILRGDERPSDAPARRDSLLSPLPVEPAVRGLPSPSHPSTDSIALPPGFIQHGGRVWCIKDGAEMAYVPAGPFTMGSDRGSADEGPARAVTLSSFLADRHEVTIWQFSRHCRDAGRAMPEQPEGANDRHPVVNVTWEEARDYAAWAGKCLPTEAQWEKGARGTDARTYPWGNEPPGEDAAHVGDPAEEGTAAVGSYPAGRSPYGLLDMVGNAWEWCADWYAADAFAKGAAKDPIGPVEGSSRVLRGGVWDDKDAGLRVTRRRRSRPGSRYDFVGFRCVKELPFGS